MLRSVPWCSDVLCCFPLAGNEGRKNLGLQMSEIWCENLARHEEGGKPRPCAGFGRKASASAQE